MKFSLSAIKESAPVEFIADFCSMTFTGIWFTFCIVTFCSLVFAIPYSLFVGLIKLIKFFF